MLKFGYKLMSEEHGPADLIRNAQRAEQAGFDFAAISAARAGLSEMPRRIALPLRWGSHATMFTDKFPGTALGSSNYSRTSRPRGDDMPSFFFHLTNGDTFPDDRATACGTLDEAKTVALAIAAELGRNRPADEIAHLTVRVTDENGSEVFRTKVVNLQHATKADEMVRASRSKPG